MIGRRAARVLRRRGNSGEMQRPMRSARAAATAPATYYVCMFPGLGLASRHHQAPGARPGREGPGVGTALQEWLGNCHIGPIGMRHKAATHRVRRAAVCRCGSAPPSLLSCRLARSVARKRGACCASPTTDARSPPDAPAPSLILFPLVARAPGPGRDVARSRSPPPETGKARQEPVDAPYSTCYLLVPRTYFCQLIYF